MATGTVHAKLASAVVEKRPDGMLIQILTFVAELGNTDTPYPPFVPRLLQEVDLELTRYDR